MLLVSANEDSVSEGDVRDLRRGANVCCVDAPPISRRTGDTSVCIRVIRLDRCSSFIVLSSNALR